MGKKIKPGLVYADRDGNIFDEPELLMLCRQGREITLPRPDELMPLPEESELYLLPDRDALGFDPHSGKIERAPFSAVAAFVSPGHTLSGTAAYGSRPEAEKLPLFSYAAVGYARGRFWVTARRVDEDKRQVFSHIDQKDVEKGAARLLKKFPSNRLVAHLTRCALTYCCPAAKNLALGRFECPLPTARHCNARCVGCISRQEQETGLTPPQNRIDFRPSAAEINQIMDAHAQKEKRPIFSFGQGCEGEPLLESELLTGAVEQYRKNGGPGTVNINTNASLPESIPRLAGAGFDSVRVSLNSARPDKYHAYYRPASYTFTDVRASIKQAKAHRLFVSLNYLFFPGVNDTEQEFEALVELIRSCGADFIQMRNLNLDPELYLDLVGREDNGGGRMGLNNFLHRLGKKCPGLQFGYFNPYLSG
ncbi:MAG: radical SAM protein [Desulfonatronovibrionaceae bacterium]